MRRSLFRMISLCAFVLCGAALASPAAACEGRSIDLPDVAGGPLCVPAELKRIVVLDPTFSLGMALELDLPVVGAPLFGMSDKVLLAEAGKRGVTDLGAFTEPNIERLVALQPDIIIGSGMLGDDVRSMLSRIAPTALIGAENWKKYYLTLAAIAGRETAAKAALARYEDRVARLRPNIPDVKVSILRITNWDFQVYLDAPDAYGPFEVLRDVGVRRSAYEQAAAGLTMKRPDWEDLAALDGDMLFYIVGGANDSDRSGRLDEVLAHPLWNMLPAVKAGRVQRLDVATWMEFSGIASANRVLDDIERYIAVKR